jgi:hypothetical protein
MPESRTQIEKAKAKHSKTPVGAIFQSVQLKGNFCKVHCKLFG